MATARRPPRRRASSSGWNASDRAPDIPLAVLGFGDRSFPAYCAFAEGRRGSRAARRAGRSFCRSTQSTASRRRISPAGAGRSERLGIDARTDHQPVQTRNRPAADARLAPRLRRRGAGPDGDPALRPAPRLAWQRLLGPRASHGSRPATCSASCPKAGRPAALFAGLWAPRRLHRDRREEASRRPVLGPALALEPGDTVSAFLRPNPGFRPGRGRAPLILIGAGTGIGPLAGFVRANRAPPAGPPVLRHAPSRQRLSLWRGTGRLAGRRACCPAGPPPSRAGRVPHYVQDALRSEAARGRELIRNGARVMVCGGRDMARAWPRRWPRSSRRPG
jgi:sulfite reductase (NADPH) flavoprotein alpha-component